MSRFTTEGMPEPGIDREDALLSAAERQQRRLEHALLNPEANPHPDVPSCDTCGKEFSGKLSCAHCGLVFYCSRACQKAAWKDGHKHSCEGMKEECEKTATEVVEVMSRISLPEEERDEDDLLKQLDEGDILERLDGTGAYKAAVSAGLNNVLLQLFERDRDQLLDRFRHSQSLYSYTASLMNYLFRGQRVEGRGAPNPNSPYCVDGERVEMYVNSHPMAFDAWFDASLELFRLPLDDEIWNMGPSVHGYAHEYARVVVTCWLFLFANWRASSCILLNNASDSGGDAAARGKSIASRIYKALARRQSVSTERDPRNENGGILLGVAAMIDVRLQEFEIKVEFEKRLKLKGSLKHFYRTFSIPFAQSSTATGTVRTQLEGDELRNPLLDIGGRNGDTCDRDDAD